MTLAKPEQPKAGLPVTRATMDAGEYMPPSPEDYAIPVLRLAQHMSKAAHEGGVAGAAPGKFYSAQTQQVWDSFIGIILRVQVGRTMFPPDGTLAGPICSSDDDIMPRAGMAYPGPCGKCPMRADAPWSMTAAERRKKCLKSFTLLLLEKETGQPFVYRVHGTGIGPLRDLNTAIRMKYKFRPFAIETEFKVESKPGPAGSFFVARPLVKHALNEEEIAGYEARAREFIGVRLEAADEDEEQEPPPVATASAPQAQQTAPADEPLKTARIRLIADPEMQYAPITMRAWTRMTGKVLNPDLSETPNLEPVKLEAWDAVAEAWNQQAQWGDAIWIEGFWKKGDVDGKLFRIFVVQNQPHILARAPRTETQAAAPAQKSLDDLPF